MGINFGFNELDQAFAFFMDLLPILLPVLLLGAVIVIVALVNLFKKALPFQDKILWLIIILVVQLLGPIIYLAVGSKMLDDKVANREENRH
ncbi:MAG: PLD nuclease N-terminal domain-containing protein [Oscillospiraceae bacterium]|nr:PLD nuclease N-terminal domain-containing protein [Oscillospiraceae bacterium]